jgi:hypothetical protein
MPQRKRVTQPIVKAGKKVLATDTAQGVIGAVADKMEEIAVDKADDAAEAVKEKAARAGGRKAATSRKSSPKTAGTRKAGTRKAKAGTRKAGTRKAGARKT